MFDIDYRKRQRSHVVLVLTLFALCSFSAFGPFSQQAGLQSADDALIRQILLNQPDYTANHQFDFIEPKGGIGAASKVAKVGRRLRGDDGDRILITEPGKPTIRIYPKRRVFSLSPADAGKKTDFAVTPEELAKRTDVTLRILGTDNIDGYECRKIEAPYNDVRLRDVKFVFCSVPQLKNLLVF
jgi:hypothetical protein